MAVSTVQGADLLETSLFFWLYKDTRVSQDWWLNNQTIYLIVKQGILSVCNLHISKTVHPIYITFDRFVAGDLRKFSVEFGAIQTGNTFNINMFWISKNK